MLQGKVVVITGASSGIGAEMAILLANHGAIPILCARSLSKMKQVAKHIANEHAIYPLDVTSTKQVFDTMSHIIDKYGKVDILINNAGFAIFESLEQAKLEDIEEMMDVNYMGLVRCTKAILPFMLERGSGHIINIASMAGKMGSAKSTGYTASKHAVLGFTNSLRQELMSTGKKIYISALNPGPIRTSFFEKADPSGHYLKSLPKWFVLNPEQVSKAVLDIILTRKAEKDIPRAAGIAVKILNLFPRSLERLIYKITNKK